MADATYTPPAVWSADTVSGGRFANINRPTAGAREERELPVGEHPFQLYSLATPNGVKATIMLEELIEAGHAGAEYDAWTINIGDGEQFGSGFVGINPNSKIPALLDQSGPAPFRVFESGAIIVHLAEKFGAFLPTDPASRAEVLSWVFWQVAQRPLHRRRVRPFLCLCAGKIRIPDQSLCDGNQTDFRRRGQAAGGQPVPRR